MHAVYAGTDLAMRQIYAEEAAQSVPVACQAGCAWCCALLVDVTPLEALGIADVLTATLPPAHLDALTRRLCAEVERLRAIPVEDRRTRTTFCVFLDDGHCTVYGARPLACRGYASRDAQACKAAYTSQYLHDVPLETRGRQSAGLSQMAFLLGALQAGLPAESYELQSAVLCALETPDAASRYARGEPVFAHALPWSQADTYRAGMHGIAHIGQLLQIVPPRTSTATQQTP
jgi:Fe-S-cluster containining protein